MVKKMKRKKIGKRLVAAVLGAVLAAGCTACGNKAEEQTAETVGNEAPEAPIEYPGLRDLGEMLAEAEGVDYCEVAGQQSGYKKGKLTESDYVSEYVGVRFTLPEGYKMDADTMDFFNELSESLLSEDSGLGAQLGLGEVFADRNVALQCEMMAVNTEGKNAAVMIMCIETDMINGVDDSGKTMEQAMEEQGFDVVSMWGQEWLHITAAETKKRNPDINTSLEEDSDMYCKLYDDAFYMIGVMYDDKSAKERNVLLSAFEETMKEAPDSTAGK